MSLIETMSGKVCMHSDVYFRTNKRNGNVSTGKLCNPSDAPATNGQIIVRNNFKTAVTNAKAILAATASDTVQTNYTKLVAYRASYKANPTFGGTLYNWVLKQEYKLLTIPGGGDA